MAFQNSKRKYRVLLKTSSILMLKKNAASPLWAQCGRNGLVPFDKPLQCAKGHSSIHRPRFSSAKAATPGTGMNYETFDVYNYRGNKLRDKLESYLKKGNISTILYSNPNNPSWICFTEQELQTIGDLATAYDIVVIEDLAYFAMDFRKDLSKPGQPPYQPTVANYTNNWLMLISSSKAFSYAGQRIGCLVISNNLYSRRFPDLKRYFSSDEFGYA
jgi:aspartate/methionine/tyrosine aminotransferase